MVEIHETIHPIVGRYQLKSLVAAFRDSVKMKQPPMQGTKGKIVFYYKRAMYYFLIGQLRNADRDFKEIHELMEYFGEKVRDLKKYKMIHEKTLKYWEAIHRPPGKV